MQTTSGDLDHRQRLSVFLVGDGRAKYFNFHCVYCGAKVAELSGGEVYQIRDTDDINARAKPVINTRCYGKFCHAWYEFTLN